jgi:transposase
MIQATPHMRVLVATQPVDFRKGIDGLVRVCRDQMPADPFSGTAFVFRNRMQTGIKILVYDGQGFWLCHKRLSKGRFKWWPSRGSKSSELASFSLQILIGGGDPEGVQVVEAWRPLSHPGPETDPAGVPVPSPILPSHEHHDISKSGDHRNRRGLH